MINYKEISELYHSYLNETNSLYHHGIKGQKWGVRRFQNEDGSLTQEGAQRYYGPKDDKKESSNKMQIPSISTPEDLDNFCSELKNKFGIDQIDPQSYVRNTIKKEQRAEIDNSADLGIETLKSFNKIDTEFMNDLSKEELRVWFMFEDQTIGLMEISRLINAGYSGKQVKNLFDQLSNDKFLDKTYAKGYDGSKFSDDLTFAAENTRYNKEKVRDKYIDECEKIFKAK